MMSKSGEQKPIATTLTLLAVRRLHPACVVSPERRTHDPSVSDSLSGSRRAAKAAVAAGLSLSLKESALWCGVV
jgi:hypothetical protein